MRLSKTTFKTKYFQYFLPKRIRKVVIFVFVIIKANLLVIRDMFGRNDKFFLRIELIKELLSFLLHFTPR